MKDSSPKWRSAKGAPPKDIDEYLAGLPEEHRAALEDLRKKIRAAAPRATEAINYGLPTFKQNGGLVAFSATENHCSLHLMSPAVAKAYQEILRPYSTTTATVHFDTDQPLPAALVTKLVKARIVENEKRGGKAKKGR